MNHRRRETPEAMQDPRTTVRRRIVSILTEEILGNPSAQSFSVGSETQLCRRFHISRVTVRLALSELESRGLIYRKHGVGTFAHGRSTRVHRHIGVLIRAPLTTENRPLAEMLRGAQTHVRSLRSALILIHEVPEEWRPELAGVLAGVIVLPEQVTAANLDNFDHRKLPFFLLGKTNLPGPRIHFDGGTDDLAAFFNTGQRAAEALTQAFLAGIPPADIRVPTPSNLLNAALI